MQVVRGSMILVLALTFGCGKAKEGAPEKDWPTASAVAVPPEITVTTDAFKSGGDAGFQHRGFGGVWNGPLDHFRIWAVLESLYHDYAQEIEAVDPTARIKRINITLRVPHWDRYFAHIQTDADDTIERWPPEDFEYFEWDEETRPSAASLKMLEDYGKAELREFDGENGAVAAWLKESGHTLEELERAWTHRAIWSEGTPVTDDLIEERMKSQGRLFNLPEAE